MVQPAAQKPSTTTAPVAPAAPQGQQKSNGNGAAKETGTGYQAAGVQDAFQAAAPTTQRAQGDTFQAVPQGQAKKAIGTQPNAAGDPTALQRGRSLSPAIGHLDSVKQKGAIDKLAVIGQPAVVADVNNAPEADKPTQGMTQDQRTAYNALPPDQQQRYDALHAQASETWKSRTVGPEAYTITPDSAVSQLRGMLTSGKMGDYLKVEDALSGPDQATNLQDTRELLFQGKLSASQVNLNGGTTLDSLAGLAQGGTTDMGVDRTQLLGQLAHDINHPESIVQGQGNADCGGSTAAFVMSLTQPSEYARMISDLGEKGQVELTPEWAKLFGAPGNEMKLGAPFDQGDPRSVTQQIFAKTFDQEAVNDQLPVTAPGQAAAAAAQGITGQQLKDGMNDKHILGGGWDAVYLPPAKDPAAPDQVTDAQRAETGQVASDMIDAAAPQRPVMANVNNHWVTVLGHDATGRYWVKDPMSGTVDRVTKDQLTTGLNSVVYQTNNYQGTVPDYMHDAGWAQPGGGGPSSGGLGSGGGSGGSAG